MTDAEKAAEAHVKRLREIYPEIYPADLERARSNFLAGYAAAQQWRGIEEGKPETLPESGKPVLILCGKQVLRAVHAPRFTLSCDNWGSFEPDGGEYDEATDSNYWPEGWYEWNLYEETHWQVEEKPTHWMPLPLPPSE